jgi:thiamine pyrophosphokinase
MSSHHIVRDAQEPALVILDSKCDAVLVHNLLEWSPTVIITTAVIDFVLQEGFKVDVVIGEANDLEVAKEKLHHQTPVKYLTKNTNDQDLLQSIYFLTTGKYTAVNILTSMDHELIESVSPFLGALDIVVYNDSCKWYYCREDYFKKWTTKGAGFHVINVLDFTLNNTPIALAQSSVGYSCICPEEGFLAAKNKVAGFWLGETI